MKKLIFIIAALLHTQAFCDSNVSKLKITHIEPECTFFNVQDEEAFIQGINEKGSELSIITQDYKKSYASKTGLNKMVRLDLSLGDFLSGIPLAYDGQLQKFKYDREQWNVIDQNMEFTRSWDRINDYKVDLINNTIELSQISFDDERKEAHSLSCRLHFVEQTAKDGYMLKKIAIYHRAHSK